MSYSFNAEFDITNSAATTAEIPLAGVEYAMVFVPAGSSLTSLAVYCSDEPGGTFHPLYTSAGSAVTLTVAHTRCYRLPDDAIGCRALKLVGNASETVRISFRE